ncbi:MAG: LacI family DNA-binding transcriptional regulator [Alkalispirochaeta sp.]
MATMKDVALRSGVSTATVSHIINDTRPVSDELRARVHAAIADLDYRPYGLARSLRRRTSHTVGVLVPDNTNPYFAEMARLLEDRFFAEGYNVIICNTEQSPSKERVYLDLLDEKAVDGMVFVSTGNDPAVIEKLNRRNTPCVLVDRDVDSVEIDRVLSDNRAGAWAATDYLIGLGHRVIACIGGPAGLTSTEDRLVGYRAAMAAAGLEPLVVHGDFQMESGRAAFRELITGRRMPTAIFASNDLMALGVLNAAATAGVGVPDDISIVGFDDIAFASYVVPALTTVRQAKDEIAGRTVRILLDKCGGKSGDNSVSSWVIQPELVIRNSTGPGRPSESTYTNNRDHTADRSHTINWERRS